ncbi:MULTISPECIES: hypothetical protein [Streptacidiphilus]|uniref:DUF3558 domain-containing protein n=1 Tax=Streptacidiphilus cavernicola TaxID=3342716 RepID=A0ABV6UUB7_9ACTN|nr:hypothetical protein [Streptacidiphilus jeojiense]
MRRPSTTLLTGTLLTGTLVGLLTAGCASAGTGRAASQAGSGSGHSAVSIAAPTSGAMRPAGAKPCPTADQWQGAPAPTAVSGTPMNTPQAEALSQAVGAQGRAGFADVYGSQITDFPAGRVALCVTDLARGHALALAAERAAPGIDLSRLDLYLCPYSQRTLDGAVHKVMAALDARGELAGFPIYSASPATDASGVRFTSSREGVGAKALYIRIAHLLGSIPYTLSVGASVGGA